MRFFVSYCRKMWQKSLVFLLNVKGSGFGQNHTYRPNRPLTEQEEAQTVWYLLIRDWCYRSVSESLIDYWHGCYIHSKFIFGLSYVSRRAYAVCYGIHIFEYVYCFLYMGVYCFCFSLDIEDTFLIPWVQVGHLKEASNKAHNAELKLFLEVQRSGTVCFSLLLGNSVQPVFQPIVLTSSFCIKKC